MNPKLKRDIETAFRRMSEPLAQRDRAMPFDYQGSISTGTLQPRHLAPRFFKVLKDLAPERAEQIRSEFPEAFPVGAEGPEVENMDPDRTRWFMESLYDSLNDSAPKNMYFGAHPGDGADFGFWPVSFLR